MKIFDVPILEKVLDLAAIRHRVIANNISNIDTPGYKAKSFSFEDELRGVLDGSGKLPMLRSDNTHIAGSRGSSIGQVSGTFGERSIETLRNDENNVDIDKEMVAVSKNNLLYSAASRIIGMSFSMLEGAIKEGRR